MVIFFVMGILPLEVTAMGAIGILLLFDILSWQEAMDKYGTDKPDLRNPLRLLEVKSMFKESKFKVFSGPSKEDNSRIACLKVPGGETLTRKQIDEYTDFVTSFGARGLAYIRVNDPKKGKEGLKSPIIKFLDEKVLKELLIKLEANVGDIIFFGAGPSQVVNDSLSALRVKLAEDLNLLTKDWAPCWIVDFPMFEFKSSGELTSIHHPFVT